MSLAPWVIVAITAASFLAVTFIGFVGVTLMRRRQRHHQRLGVNATAVVKQHNSKYYYRQTHSREGSFERPWPGLGKSHCQRSDETAELQRSQLIGKARASRESWSSYGGSVMGADSTTYLPQQQPQLQQQQQSSFSRPHAYTALSAHDQQHPTASTSTSRAEGASASRSHGQYRYDDCDSEDDNEHEPAPQKKPMSSSDWKELEAQTGRIRSSSLQDPATLGRGHPAFSPELQRAPLPAKLPRTLVVTDVAGRRAVT
ncbi:hypothetical protein PG997_006773 [Apiospora hydei]|uniref:Uncharacterized protein n=1 Tax=Apiospora hydei TaxID=1337664 RepID=A0ABR1WPM1_9PEZI